MFACMLQSDGVRALNLSIMSILKTDKRYSIDLEFTGEYKEKPKSAKQGQIYVARFCGKWIGKATTKKEAELLCIFHDDERTVKIL